MGLKMKKEINYKTSSDEAKKAWFEYKKENYWNTKLRVVDFIAGYSAAISDMNNKRTKEINY